MKRFTTDKLSSHLKPTSSHWLPLQDGLRFPLQVVQLLLQMELCIPEGLVEDSLLLIPLFFPLDSLSIKLIKLLFRLQPELLQVHLLLRFSLNTGTG